MESYKAQVVFDTPLYEPEGKYGPYYSMMIELPEGSPGTRYDEDRERTYAYLSFDEGAKEEPILKALGRGDELQVVWTGRSYKPMLSGETTVSPKPAAATSAAAPPKSLEPTSPTLIKMGMERLAWKTVDAALSLYTKVSEDERAESLNSDEKLRITLSGVIQANRDSSRELAYAIEQVEHEYITGVDAGDLPGSLLQAIADLLPDKYEGVEQVGSKLKELGLSSADIDKDDPSTWVEMYQIAKSVPAHEAEAEEVADFEDEESDDELPPF